MARLNSQRPLAPRVGIFLSNYSVGHSSQTMNSATVLAKRGYNVDILLHDCQGEELVQLKTRRIEIHNLVAIPRREKRRCSSEKRHSGLSKLARVFLGPDGAGRRLPRALRRRVELVLNSHKEHCFFPETVRRRAREIAASRPFTCFICIEAHGLVLGGLLASELGIPYFYYSLELYLRDHPAFSGLWFRALKQLERKYHQRSIGTIIQDPQRARLLCAHNGVSNGVVHYVPVSLLGPPVRRKSRWFYEKLRIPVHKKIVLQLGVLHSHRLSGSVVKAAQGFPDDWVMVMHGLVRDKEMAELKKLDLGNRIFFSTDLVPIDELTDVVASADIGLVFYRDYHANTRLIGLSSEKLARYLQCGIPVITNDFPSLKRIIETYRCGVCVSHVGELVGAIDSVLSHLAAYRKNALRCYEENYEFSRHFSRVVDHIDALASGGHNPAGWPHGRQGTVDRGS